MASWSSRVACREDGKFDEAFRVRAQKNKGKVKKIDGYLEFKERISTPRSPGCNTFENVEDSDEDETELANEDDIASRYENIDSSADFIHNVDAKIQNSSAAPFRGPVHDQRYRAAVNEVIPLLELFGNAKVDGASAMHASLWVEDGVVHVYSSDNDIVELFPVASSTFVFSDMHHLLKIMSTGNKFRLHLLVNADREFLAQKGAPHRDFYIIRKVDTQVTSASFCLHEPEASSVLHQIETNNRTR
ncbi:hypothetical protein QYF36_008105 [Acer negundo]|nr:hypothetical protein QYF36_008105 [Acer negundo]